MLPRRLAPVAAVALAIAGALGASSPAPEFERALAAAAEASRTAGLAAALRSLEPWLADGRAERDDARVVLGLLAHRHDDPLRAAELLGAGPGPAELEDWRLYVLADSRAALGAVAEARATMVELLRRAPDTPLRPRVLVRLVELAGEAGDLAAVHERLEQGRAERLPGESAIELERVAWRLGLERRDTAMMAAAARRLLVLAPLEASKLKVVDTLNGLGYERSDWRLWLEADELRRRAEALLDAELSAGALTTLAAVAESERDIRWHLLEARALVAAGRGAEALVRLGRIAVPDAEARTQLDWWRATAAADAARSRGGRIVAPAEAERLRRLERELLLAVARAEGAGELAARALARLGAGYLDDGRTTEAVAAYRQLAVLHPTDTSGARPLFERGWREFDAGGPAQAIALWRDLVELYPNAASARSARYWTARALDQSGQPATARALYRELLAADTADFYARQAALRLAGAEATLAPPATDPQIWPIDRKLARVERLTAIGLDGLARTELALVGDGAEPRARAALTAKVLARLGERRASLGELRRAFPELGTAHQRHLPAAALELYYPTDFRTEITRAAAHEQVDPYVVFAIVHQESAFDPKAHSRSGARGLMQLMPATGQEVARRIGLPFSTTRLYDPGYSVRLGTRYFRQMLGQFDDRVELALAGYNGGPGRISRLWRAAGPEPELDRFLEGLALAESRNYVKRILVLAESYRSLYPGLG